LRRRPLVVIIDKLNKEINAALADPQITARVADLASTVLIASPADLDKLVIEQTAKWRKVVEEAAWWRKKPLAPLMAIASSNHSQPRCEVHAMRFPQRWISCSVDTTITRSTISVREQAAACQSVTQSIVSATEFSASFLRVLRRNLDNQQPSEKFH
jgi:hypothetical protein